MKNKKIIVFDIGLTLIHPDFEKLKLWLDSKVETSLSTYSIESAFRKAVGFKFLDYEEDHEVSEAQRFFRYTMLDDRLSQNQITEYWKQLVSSGGANSWLYNKLNKNTHYVLEQLKNKGHILVAASNSDGTLVKELRNHSLDIFFDQILDSEIILKSKPDVAFYQEILSSRKDQEIIHIGDDLVNDFIAPSNLGFNQLLLFDPCSIYKFIPGHCKFQNITDLLNLI